MLPINKKLRLIFIGLATNAVAGLVVTILLAILPRTWDLSKSLDLYFYNKMFQPRLRPPANILIIDSNDPAGNRSRSEYAAMIRQLQQAGVKSIAFDLVFLAPHDYDPEGDREFVESVSEFPQVILAINFGSDQPPSPSAKMILEQLALPGTLCQVLLPRNIAIRQVELPFDHLMAVVRHVGHINTANKEYHHFPAAMTFEGKCYASLPVELARVYFESEESLPLSSEPATNGHAQSRTTSDHLFRLIKNHLDEDGQLLVNFISEYEFRSNFFSWNDAKQLLQSRADRFQNAVVLIVNPSADAQSYVPSPLGPYPSWALLTSITSQLLLGKYIDASVVFVPAIFSSTLALLGLMWLLFVAPRLDKKWQKTRVIFVAGAGLFLFLIFVLLHFGRQWIGVVIPLLMFNFSMLVVRKLYYQWTKSPQYVPLGLAVLERQGTKYPVQVFESEVGVDTSDISFDSFLEDEKFQVTISRIKEWEAKREDLRWIGNKLFNALFQNEVYHLLQNSLDKAQRENKYVRLKLRLDAPELVCLPWELMHSTDLDSEYITLHRRLSLVRYLPVARPYRKLQSRSPLKILVFISRTKDLKVLEEREDIKKTLKPLIRSWDVRMRICEQATMENLGRELEHKPDILHYIGHADFDDGQNEAYLEFESEQKVFARTLKSLLAESSIKLAVLNSCKTAAAAKTDAFTGVAQNLVKVGIPAVVAMQLKIPDDTAAWFSEIFYSKFLRFYSIAVAVAETRRKIMERTELDQQHWATPVLFMRDGEPIRFDPS
jgi:CHASE2 domain-containing sensor protein